MRFLEGDIILVSLSDYDVVIGFSVCTMSRTATVMKLPLSWYRHWQGTFPLRYLRWR